ncbi:MAG TPA: RluA family pseudouridine synthase [Rectinemataceae bacterium]|nr:RluA family pseudouridine synthase [Rectinemataceae bacterium]
MHIDIPVIHSDPFILAVDKSAGYLAIPDRYDPDAPVLAERLRKDWGRLFVVHRIDRDTTGLLLYARSPEAHRAMSEAFSTGAVKKVYRALVRGIPEWTETRCELPLKVDGDRLHRTVVDGHRGKACSTGFRVVETYAARGAFPGATLIEALPESGRTHQIRVHLSALGFPCLCDPLYGDGKPFLLSSFKKRWKGDPFEERPLLARSALHALSAEFLHPDSGEPMRLEAPLPKDMRAAITQLGKS